MTHLDLFTGFGGFSLAAAWTGFKTVVQCESDQDRRYCLKRTWKLPVIQDVRQFDGTLWTGATLLTAGVPCQPSSTAGKRRGEKDHRWLWPEAIRVAREARPAWALFENPPGILTMGIDGILAELARSGYTARLVDIPACAVDAPHVRHRIWLLAYRSGQGQQGSHTAGKLQAQRGPAERDPVYGLADGNGVDIRAGLRPAETHRFRRRRSGYLSDWNQYEWVQCFEGDGSTVWRRTKPGIRGLDDGLPAGVRNRLVAALGDAIVPQVAAEILEAIRKVEHGR